MQRLLLVLLGLAAGLLAAEGMVRLAGVAPEVTIIERGRFRLSDDPRLRYEPVPAMEYRGPLSSFHDYSGRSNRLGFRDRNHPVAKPPGVQRILILGDSLAVGQGVRRREAIFPARLEGKLRERGRPAEVLNLAVSGYDTGQEVAMLEARGLPFAPDVVLVAYCHNDRRRSDGGILASLLAAERRAGMPRAFRYHPVLAESALYRFLRYRLKPPPESDGPGPAEDRVAPAFDRLAALAAEHEFRVLVAIFPRFGGLLDYRYGAEHEAVAGLARGRGFAVVDLLGPFQSCRHTAEGPLAHDRYHPTARGHACAAEALSRHLIAHWTELSR